MAPVADASTSAADAAIAAVRDGELVVLPTDTVYGLCATPYTGGAASRIYRLKRRPETQPLSLLACDVDMLLELVPELRGRAAVIARALLPGPYTLVLPNPARRYPWLTGGSRETIGVRVAELVPPAAPVVEAVGAVVATSANLSGGPEPARFDEISEEIHRGCAVALDGGELPGIASTVLDFTTQEPRVLREGAAPAAEAFERVAAALR